MSTPTRGGGSTPSGHRNSSSSTPSSPLLPTSTALKKAFDVSYERAIRSVTQPATPVERLEWLRSFLRRCFASVGVASPQAFLGGSQQEGEREQADTFVGAMICVLCFAVELIARGHSGWMAPLLVGAWWGSSLVIFALFRFLGTTRSLSAVTNAIGFSMVPLVLAEPLMSVLEQPLPGLAFGLKVFVVLWASRSASFTLATTDTEQKVFLLALPLGLIHVLNLSFR